MPTQNITWFILLPLSLIPQAVRNAEDVIIVITNVIDAIDDMNVPAVISMNAEDAIALILAMIIIMNLRESIIFIPRHLIGAIIQN